MKIRLEKPAVSKLTGCQIGKPRHTYELTRTERVSTAFETTYPPRKCSSISPAFALTPLCREHKSLSITKLIGTLLMFK